MCTTVTALSKFSANCRVTTDMDVRVTACAAAGVLVWTGLGHAQPPAITSELPTVVIQVEDLAGLRPDVMESAVKELVRIYALAGVHAVWKNTGPVTAEKDGGPAVTVRVLDAALSDWFATRSGFDGEKLGAAVRGARLAYVFYPRIELVARFYHRHLGTLLGRAVAHEVGHLLLPPGSHSNIGVMQADLDVRSLLPTRFTSSQAAEITKTLRTWHERQR